LVIIEIEILIHNERSIL